MSHNANHAFERNAFGEPITLTEPTAWLREAAAMRARQATFLGADVLHNGGVVIIPIGGRSGINDPIEDRTCDRCRTYVPPGEFFAPFRSEFKVPPGRVIVFGGLCAGCASKETGDD